MNKEIQFFDYSQCFNHYAKRIMSIRQAKINGEVILAKPVLLVAIIDEVLAPFAHSSVVQEQSKQ